MLTIDKHAKAVSRKPLFTFLTLMLWCIAAFAQNDNCSAATVVFSNGFNTGILSPTTPVDISLATVEAGESFAPPIVAAGQTQKSLWYKFTLPTTRSVSIVLAQQGALISPGDVGLAVYKTSACLPGNPLLSTKLAPLTTFDTTSDNCLEAGTYLIQVSARSAANGLVSVQLIIKQPAAAYDLTTQAYDFGTVSSTVKSINYAVDCQSTEDITELCTALKNYEQYNKSSWHVFTTPASFNKISFSVLPQNPTTGQVIGFRLFKGNIRISAVTVITSCDSLQIDAANMGSRSYSCSELQANTIYSVELFFREDFNSNIEVGVVSSAPATQSTDITTCGASYTLPWGPVVSSSGTYSDTLRAVAGCDSLVRTINLAFGGSSVATIQNKKDTICIGTIYTLPWGITVDTAGQYKDTLQYTSGCDSVIRIIDLTVNRLTRDTTRIMICEGDSYALPSGGNVIMPGFYSDTLRYSAFACDSLIRVVDLSVNKSKAIEDTVALCAGGSYALPWGPVVNTAGEYRDTVRYVSGCDSVIRSVFVKINAPLLRNSNAFICAGQSYTLPSGTVVSSPGIYYDTLRAIAGCDSLLTTVNLTFTAPRKTDTSVTICQGQFYTLPWGPIVKEGDYEDTIRTTSGCDSLVKAVHVRLNAASIINETVTICAGKPYTLPWGVIVTSPGVYRDTLRYIAGCDSLIRMIKLAVAVPLIDSVVTHFCPGSSYVLPWGEKADKAGIYRDTLRYADGCDSVIHIVNLVQQTSTTISVDTIICNGQSFTLYSGAMVNTSGTYSDTIKTSAGCDSLVRIIHLTVISPTTETISVSICSGEIYQLPWGVTVNVTGTYADTLKSVAGCDSLLRTVHLTVNPSPFVHVTKSNDIDCMLGTTKLVATGGTTYLWMPGGSLSDSTVPNPLAAPTASTTYRVQVTADNGCVAEDSILVAVNAGNVGDGYLLPNAFTPDNDGLNDCFGVRHWGAVTNLSFSIYNRWGQMVFQTSNPAQCWDGTYKGAPLPSGTFVYLVNAKTLCGTIQRKGTVTLIR